MNISPLKFAYTQSLYCLMLTAPRALIWSSKRGRITINQKGMKYIREQARVEARRLLSGE